MFPVAMARSSCGTLTISHIAPRQEGVFFPIDNALYSVAFGTHIKTAEPIDMPFGMMSGLGLTNSVLREGDGSWRGRGNFGENMPDKPNTANNCDFSYEGPISP